MTEESLILQIKGLHEAYQKQLAPLIDRLAEIQAKKLPSSVQCPSVIGLDDYVIKKIISEFEHLEILQNQPNWRAPLAHHDMSKIIK